MKRSQKYMKVCYTPSFIVFLALVCEGDFTAGQLSLVAPPLLCFKACVLVEALPLVLFSEAVPVV